MSHIILFAPNCTWQPLSHSESEQIKILLPAHGIKISSSGISPNQAVIQTYFYHQHVCKGVTHILHRSVIRRLTSSAQPLSLHPYACNNELKEVRDESSTELRLRVFQTAAIRFPTPPYATIQTKHSLGDRTKV